jgi:hypothetical protein
MKQPRVDPPRLATVTDADTVAGLLDAFNREYDDPTPGIDILAARLERLLPGGEVIALLTGEPGTGFALLTVPTSGTRVQSHCSTSSTSSRNCADEARLRAVGSRRGGDSSARRRVARDQRRRGRHDARRFYERHGYANSEPGEDEPLLYYYRELGANLS